jgi:hypothetical protein
MGFLLLLYIDYVTARSQNIRFCSLCSHKKKGNTKSSTIYKRIVFIVQGETDMLSSLQE